MNNLIVRKFNGNEIHTFMWNNKLCWIATEVVSVFDYISPTKTIQDCIKAEEFEVGEEYEVLKGDALKLFKATTLKVVPSLKYTSQIVIFYEDGLYGFLQYSDKPIGIAFRKWLRRDVLPELRQHGTYSLKSNENDKPWFIKKYKDTEIITINDLNKLLGIDVIKIKQFFRREYFTPAIDWNGLGQGHLREKFEKDNNVHYEEETFLYLYKSGVVKALKILGIENKIDTHTSKSILKALFPKECDTNRIESVKPRKNFSTQINIIIN